MIIGLDLDDTITNSSDIFIKYAKEYNDINNIIYNINTNEFNQKKAFGWNKEQQNEFSNLYLEKILLEATPKKNAVEVINKLYKNGNKIIIITARQNNENIDMYELTKKWLDKYNIKYNELIIESCNKRIDCIKNGVNLFVDVDIYNNLKIPLLMFSTNYNKSYKYIERVNNWNEIDKIITKIIEKRNANE